MTRYYQSRPSRETQLPKQLPVRQRRQHCPYLCRRLSRKADCPAALQAKRGMPPKLPMRQCGGRPSCGHHISAMKSRQGGNSVQRQARSRCCAPLENSGEVWVANDMWRYRRVTCSRLGCSPFSWAIKSFTDYVGLRRSRTPQKRRQRSKPGENPATATDGGPAFHLQ